MKPNLKAVPQSDKPLEMGPDIYAADKAKRESIDWAMVHIRSDRRSPVNLLDTPKRRWLA